MKKIDATTRTSTLLTIFSATYALLDMNIMYLAPILTVVIPYKFMKEKDESKTKENRKIFNNLFIFNIIAFLGVMVITNKSSFVIIEIITNILITLVYFKVISSMEKKREDVFENPEIAYQKINKQINALEMIYEKAKEDMENTENEKAKTSLQVKVDTIKIKIDQAKEQLAFLEKQIELKDNTQNHN